MKILAIIPARGGSKGVPGKNTKLLHGKPLLQYTISAAKSSKYISRCIVSTDETDIQDIARALGAEAPFLRPKTLAEDITPTLPVLQHTLRWLAENEGDYYDAVCLLQATSPFRPAGFIDDAIEKFAQSGADALVSVLPVPDTYNPHWVFEPNDQGFLQVATGDQSIITQRQALPSAFFRDGSVYLTKTEVLLHQNSLYGSSLAYLESDPAFYCNIDTQEDWDKAEKLALTLCAE